MILYRTKVTQNNIEQNSKLNPISSYLLYTRIKVKIKIPKYKKIKICLQVDLKIKKK